MKVIYEVTNFEEVRHCKSGITFRHDEFEKVKRYAKEVAEYYGSAWIDKKVWNNGKIIKHEAIILKADGSIKVVFKK